MTRTALSLTVMIVAVTLACDAATQQPPAMVREPTQPQQYAFATSTNVRTLWAKFDAPEGFERVELAPNSFGTWLRRAPVLNGRTTVRSHTGRKLSSPSAGIIDIDVGEKNLQQCADSAIRLHAEWLWTQGRKDDLAYHFTSGDEVRYRDWVKGERISARGSQVKRSRGAKRADTHASMRAWLDLVFMYAGTQSLHRDSTTVSPRDVAPGDFFVAPGSPGHAVVVLDVAEHDDGRRVALLGQGFMPAQEFHVLRDRGSHVVDGVWFVLPDTTSAKLRTPSWKPFTGAQARRFRP